MSELLRIEYGTARRYDQDKGFGFIICPQGGVDIYFHRDNFYTVENRNGRVMFVLARKSRQTLRVPADVEVAFIREVRSNGRVIASKWVFAREYRMIQNQTRGEQTENEGSSRGENRSLFGNNIANHQACKSSCATTHDTATTLQENSSDNPDAELFELVERAGGSNRGKKTKPAEYFRRR